MCYFSFVIFYSAARAKYITNNQIFLSRNYFYFKNGFLIMLYGMIWRSRVSIPCFRIRVLVLYRNYS